MKLSNRKWTDEEFLEQRKEVLAMWPTGKEVDLNEAVRYQKRLPDSKIFSKKVDKCREEGTRCICPMSGKGTIEETTSDVQYLVECGADAAFIISDAYTRKLELQKVQKGIETSIRTGKSALNGYPFINYGVKTNRKFAEKFNIAWHCNGGNDEDPRLVSEIVFASGWTCSILHDLRDLITHSKHYSLEKRIQNNQYTAKLASYYTERGAPIEMNAVGTLAIYAPPSMGNAIEILEALTGVEQGVKHMSLCYDVMGNMVQSVAGIRVLRKLTEEYFHKFGHDDVQLHMSAFPWQYAWPRDTDRAAGLTAWLCTIGAMADVDWYYAKSLDEGAVTPYKESIGASIKIHKQIILSIGNQTLPESDALKEEEAIMEMETRAIIEKALELADGDPAIARVRGVEAGVIDAPFSPWQHLKGKAVPLWDKYGAIRWLEHGDVPLPKEAIKYHKAKIRERERAEKKTADMDMVIEDLKALTRPFVKQAIETK